jgi:hypothetical protein
MPSDGDALPRRHSLEQGGQMRLCLEGPNIHDSTPADWSDLVDCCGIHQDWQLAKDRERNPTPETLTDASRHLRRHEKTRLAAGFGVKKGQGGMKLDLTPLILLYDLQVLGRYF